ncbi:hypothetical protein VKS41_007880 [Umbelopsis sp. WA50703]
MVQFTALSAALILGYAASLVSAGTFAACVNSNGVNCTQRSCAKGECCNFQADIKNNMASGWVDNSAGCTIYYNSGCQGTSWKMTSLSVVNLPASIKNNNAAVRCNY